MHGNEILAVLDQSQGSELKSASRRIEFDHGHFFCHVDEPITDMFFPLSGLVSVVVDLEDGECVEAAMLGCRGVVGGAAAFGGTEHIATAFGQMPGVGWLVPGARVAELSDRNPQLRKLLFRQEQYISAQAQQTAACNGRHPILQRLSSWLLRARAAAGAKELLLTQEYLAQMLGVQRATVSVSASALADAGAIEYRRGRITIVDAERLASFACECHRALAARRDRLFDGRVRSEQALLCE